MVASSRCDITQALAIANPGREPGGMTPTVAMPMRRLALWAWLLLGAGCDRASSGSASGSPSASAAEAIPIAPALPTSNSATPAPSNALLVMLSRKGLSIGGEGAILAAADVDSAEWSKGFGSKYKRGSRADFYLLPLGSALQAAYPGDASAPPVAIAADSSISYRMLTETIYTLGQQRVKTLDLLVRTTAGRGAIPLTLPGRFDVSSAMSDDTRRAVLQLLGRDAAAPSSHAGLPLHSAESAGAPPATPVPLDLNVIVTPTGFVVSAARRRMGPGCDEAGAGTAVPKHDDAYDFAALTACATKIKSSDPRFATEMRVTVTADADADVQTLIATLDALRGAEGRLFSDVMLGVPK
jgi:biopolymer transport protein ExbD